MDSFGVFGNQGWEFIVANRRRFNIRGTNNVLVHGLEGDELVGDVMEGQAGIKLFADFILSK